MVSGGGSRGTVNNANRRPKSESIPDLRKVVSRKDVNAVTMNMNGQSGLGLTPRYKIDIFKEYLIGCKPDVIVVQDAIDPLDFASVVGPFENYQWYFRPDHSNLTLAENSKVSDDEDDGRCVTGIVWNKEKYKGTPLQIDDDRLSDFSPWLKKHNIVIVKLDSCQRSSSGAEDIFPSFVAISWHGPDYEIALRQRNQICEEFFSFLSLLRKKNWFVPILIGGDFNIDLKSYSGLDKHADFLYVPYRPISGNLAKDLKNTFLFTVDSLQVTETSFKQYHPDIYPSPFISIRLRGRTKIKLWAVIKIQRSVRAYLRRIRETRLGRKKLKENKKRWKKKIEGENYISEPETDDEDSKVAQAAPTSTEPSKIGHHKTAVNQDAIQVSANGDVERKVSGPVEGGTGMGYLVPSGPNHRRKRYSDLKSVYEKRQEMQSNEPLMRTYTNKKAEKFEF